MVRSWDRKVVQGRMQSLATRGSWSLTTRAVPPSLVGLMGATQEAALNRTTSLIIRKTAANIKWDQEKSSEGYIYYYLASLFSSIPPVPPQPPACGVGACRAKLTAVISLENQSHSVFVHH